MIVYDPSITHPHWVDGSWQHLEGNLTKSNSVLEWGGGQSSRWLAERCGVLWTVENSLEWCSRILMTAEEYPNAHLIWAGRNNPSYVSVLADMNKEGGFDVVIIDGHQREGCLAQALMHLSEKSILVLDDAYDFVPDGLIESIRWDSVKHFDAPHPHHNRYPKRTSIYVER